MTLQDSRKQLEINNKATEVYNRYITDATAVAEKQYASVYKEIPETLIRKLNVIDYYRNRYPEVVGSDEELLIKIEGILGGES